MSAPAKVFFAGAAISAVPSFRGDGYNYGRGSNAQESVDAGDHHRVCDACADILWRCADRVALPDAFDYRAVLSNSGLPFFLQCAT